MTNEAAKSNLIREQVRQGYSRIAEAGVFTTAPSSSLGASSGCCSQTNLDVEALVKNIGYSDSELASSPASANMGLSCGNPTAIASLQPGETVLDLGSGGGFDVFIAGSKVGQNGRVIGVDMTPAMITKARGNIAEYVKHRGYNNVEFRLGEIEHLPVADASVDVIISNCVLNLSPAKPQVWQEIARVLRPGGRVAVSDLALLKPLPEAVISMVEALVGCVAGAVLVSELNQMASAAGFSEISIVSKPEYVDAMASWQDPLYESILSALPTGNKASDYITSVDISAKKV